MGNEQQIILEINVGDSLTKTAELRQSMNQLIELRKQLVEEVKKGGIEEAKQLEAVNVALRTQQQEYRTQTKIIDGYVAQKKAETNVSNFANNSIQQNRDLLKQLTAQYIQLKNPSLSATNQIKQLTDTLKKQEGVIGDTRRNVGNYFNEFTKGIPVLGSIIDPLKNISKGFSESGFSAQGFSAAFAAGIPLIIGGVQGLITIMQKFDSVTEGIEDTMSGVNQSFDFFVGHANDGSLSDLVKGMQDAYDAGVQLSQVMRQLAEAQDFQRVVDAQANKEVEALLIKSKDRTADAKERIKFLDEASAKEKKNLEQNIALAQQRVDLAEQEFKRIIEAGLNDDAAKKSLNDANVALINQQRESGNLQEKILNRRNALLDEIRTAEEKSNAKRLAEEKKLADEEEKIRQKNIDNDIKVAQIQEQTSKDYLTRLKGETDEAFKIRQEAYDKQLELQNTSSAQFLSTEEKTKAEEIRIAKATAAEKQAIQQAEIGFASNISKGLIGLISKVAEASGASAAFSKTLALVEIGTQTAIALATGIASSQDLPYPANLVAMGTTIAGVLASIGSAIAILTNTPDAPAPNFAGGVIGLHGPGTETSDDISANLSVGESVMTARATKKYHRELAWMEASVGNTPNYQFGSGHFANGFIPLSDGGFAARAANDSQIASTIQRAIMKGFSLAPTPKLSIVEFESKQASRNRSVNVSEA